MPLLGEQHAPGVRGKHRKHAEALTLIPQRQVKTGRGGKCVRAQPRLATMVGHPLCHCEIRRPKRLIECTIAWVAQFAFQIWKQYDSLALEDLGEVSHGHTRHAGDTARGGELSTHGIQKRRAPLASPRNACLLPYAGHKVCDNEGYGQHHAERQKVLHVRDCEGKPGRNEEEIKSSDVKDCRHHRGTPTKPQSRDGHPQEVNHHEVG